MNTQFVILVALALALGTTSFSGTARAAEPKLSAALVDRLANAKKGWAMVETKVSGIELASSPKSGGSAPEGHLHYKVDDGPVVATTATRLGFHALAPGVHHIQVQLVGSDHQPLGPVTNLDLRVPPGAGDASD
jgi:hypothetical protein